jgi:hypothetical protein
VDRLPSFQTNIRFSGKKLFNDEHANLLSRYVCEGEKGFIAFTPGVQNDSSVADGIKLSTSTLTESK